MYVRLTDVCVFMDTHRAAGSRADSTACFLVMLFAILPRDPVAATFQRQMLTVHETPGTK